MAYSAALPFRLFPAKPGLPCGSYVERSTGPVGTDKVSTKEVTMRAIMPVVRPGPTRPRSVRDERHAVDLDGGVEGERRDADRDPCRRLLVEERHVGVVHDAERAH